MFNRRRPKASEGNKTDKEVEPRVPLSSLREIRQSMIRDEEKKFIDQVRRSLDEFSNAVLDDDDISRGMKVIYVHNKNQFGKEILDRASETIRSFAAQNNISFTPISQCDYMRSSYSFYFLW